MFRRRTIRRRRQSSTIFRCRRFPIWALRSSCKSLPVNNMSNSSSRKHLAIDAAPLLTFCSGHRRERTRWLHSRKDIKL